VQSPALALMTFPAPADGPAHRLADATAPALRADDLAATRGDGIFESILMTGGRLHGLGAHLRRMQRSAAMSGLPEIDVDAWAAAAHAVAAEHPAVPELMVKLCYSRGIEGSGVPTGWLLAFPNGDVTRERTEGADVLLLERGVSSDLADRAPWLLLGAKTLSYAMNLAAQRHARAAGADDVLFTSTDGLVMEGPTSTLVATYGDEIVTPVPEIGILPGTTQERVFAWARGRGMRPAHVKLPVEQLASADTLWLVSSGRLCVPIRSLDGVARRFDAGMQADLLHHLTTVPDGE
jgi:4-amino-4-deoxychorismate lyase